MACLDIYARRPGVGTILLIPDPAKVRGRGGQSAVTPTRVVSDAEEGDAPAAPDDSVPDHDSHARSEAAATTAGKAD